MDQHVVEELRASFARYQQATAEAQRPLEPGPEADAVAAELRAARVELCRVLERTGWTPPADVASQVRADQEQLARRHVLTPRTAEDEMLELRPTA